jgi:DNA-binding NarL/FixJ family response regulator
VACASLRLTFRRAKKTIEGRRKGEQVTRARILVAEDHALMRKRVVRLLKGEFEVLDAAADGQELLELAARLNPDVCVLDICMPIMNGIEAAGQLRQNGSTAKIIFLTLYNDSDFVRAALKSGAEGYVIKAQMAADLPLAVREVLAGRTFLSAGCT